MKRKFTLMAVCMTVGFGLFLGFTITDDSPTGSRTGSTEISSKTNPVAVTYDNSAIKFTDNMDGANDTTALKSRGYWPFYRGTGPQGIAATWFQGTAIFTSFNGPATGYVAANFQAVTGVNNIDSWLILPKGGFNGGDTLSFYERSTDLTDFPDSMRVMWSATGDSIPEGSWVELGRFRNTDAGWTQRNFVAPSGTNGRFAIRYCVFGSGPSGNNGDFVGLDAITVHGPAGGPTMVDPNIVCNYGLIPQYPGGSLWGHASETIGDTLYIVGGAPTVGGTGGGTPSTTVTRYAVNSGVWSVGTPLPTAKSGGDLVSVGGSMYYIGGGNTVITAGDNITYKYTPSTGWSTVANIPTPVTGNTAQVWGDSVIFCIAGGWSTYLTTIQVYRIGSNTWTTSTALPGGTGRRTFASGISGNKIYVAGGYSGVFRKDLRIGTIGADATTITWSTGPDIPCRGTGVSRNGGLAINNKFYVLASETSPAPFQQDSIFILNTQTDTWTPQILIGRGANTASNYWGVLSSSVLPDGTIKIWIPGGSLTGAADETRLITLTDSAHCTVTGITDPIVNTPDKYSLSQNYPNPFNPSTQIKFDIPVNGLVSLKIYDMVGREVATLVNEVKAPGNYIVDFNASGLASGTYFYRLQAGDFTQVKKMVLLK